MEREQERSRAEEERLHKEVRRRCVSCCRDDRRQDVSSLLLLLLQNSRYREEVLDLSSRNLQLSDDNAELSARLRGEQESVRMLRERLATVSKEQEEGGATVRDTCHMPCQ